MSVEEKLKMLRQKAKVGEIPYYVAARTVACECGQVKEAISLALEGYEENQNEALLSIAGDFCVYDGQFDRARRIFQDQYKRKVKLHVTNLIFSGVSAIIAMVDDDRKLLYIPIPKCGSSTAKNFFTVARFGQYYGETVHFKHPGMYRVVTRKALQNRYSEYFKFTIVRDPIARLRSYFMLNINDGSLEKEACKVKSFMGLFTRPGPAMVKDNFDAYRQHFKDFRHHTDPMSAYLDPVAGSLDRVFQMSEIQEVKSIFEDRYDTKIENRNAMVSKETSTAREQCEQAFAGLRDWYKADYKYMVGA